MASHPPSTPPSTNSKSATATTRASSTGPIETSAHQILGAYIAILSSDATSRPKQLRALKRKVKRSIKYGKLHPRVKVDMKMLKGKILARLEECERLVGAGGDAGMLDDCDAEGHLVGVELFELYEGEMERDSGDVTNEYKGEMGVGKSSGGKGNGRSVGSLAKKQKSVVAKKMPGESQEEPERRFMEDVNVIKRVYERKLANAEPEASSEALGGEFRSHSSSRQAGRQANGAVLIDAAPPSTPARGPPRQVKSPTAELPRTPASGGRSKAQNVRRESMIAHSSAPRQVEHPPGIQELLDRDPSTLTKKQRHRRNQKLRELGLFEEAAKRQSATHVLGQTTSERTTNSKTKSSEGKTNDTPNDKRKRAESSARSTQAHTSSFPRPPVATAPKQKKPKIKLEMASDEEDVEMGDGEGAIMDAKSARREEELRLLRKRKEPEAPHPKGSLSKRHRGNGVPSENTEQRDKRRAFLQELTKPLSRESTQMERSCSNDDELVLHHPKGMAIPVGKGSHEKIPQSFYGSSEDVNFAWEREHRMAFLSASEPSPEKKSMKKTGKQVKSTSKVITANRSTPKPVIAASSAKPARTDMRSSSRVGSKLVPENATQLSRTPSGAGSQTSSVRKPTEIHPDPGQDDGSREWLTKMRQYLRAKGQEMMEIKQESGSDRTIKVEIGGDPPAAPVQLPVSPPKPPATVKRAREKEVVRSQPDEIIELSSGNESEYEDHESKRDSDAPTTPTRSRRPLYREAREVDVAWYKVPYIPRKPEEFSRTPKLTNSTNPRCFQKVQPKPPKPPTVKIPPLSQEQKKSYRTWTSVNGVWVSPYRSEKGPVPFAELPLKPSRLRDIKPVRYTQDVVEIEDDEDDEAQKEREEEDEEDGVEEEADDDDDDASIAEIPASEFKESPRSRALSQRRASGTQQARLSEPAGRSQREATQPSQLSRLSKPATSNQKEALQQQNEAPKATQRLPANQQATSDAQILSTAARGLPSLRSVETLESEIVSNKALIEDEVHISTQEEFAKAQKSLQEDLISPNKPSQTHPPRAQARATTPKTALTHQSHQRSRPTSSHLQKELPKVPEPEASPAQELLTTQAIIDQMSPFTATPSTGVKSKKRRSIFSAFAAPFRGLWSSSAQQSTPDDKMGTTEDNYHLSQPQEFKNTRQEEISVSQDFVQDPGLSKPPINEESRNALSRAKPMRAGHQVIHAEGDFEVDEESEINDLSLIPTNESATSDFAQTQASNKVQSRTEMGRWSHPFDPTEASPAKMTLRSTAGTSVLQDAQKMSARVGAMESQAVEGVLEDMEGFLANWSPERAARGLGGASGE